MDKRRAERTRKRLSCTLELADGHTSGMILDLSAVGLFIQTGAKLDPGDRTTVEFEGPESGQPLRLQCRVVRRRRAKRDSPKARESESTHLASEGPSLCAAAASMT